MLVFCNFIWGSQFVMVKVAQEQMGPVFVTFFPMTIATLMLIPIVYREAHKNRNGAKTGRMPLADLRDFILIGVCGQVSAQLGAAWGVRLTGAEDTALLMLCLPVCTAVMAYLFLGERMTLVRWISFALAIAGVLECSGINWSSLNFASGKFLLGNLLVLGSVLGSSFYNTYSKRLLLRYTPLQVLLYSYYAVFAFMLPITVYCEPMSFLHITHFKPAVWTALTVLAVLQYGLTMVLLLIVLSRLDATQAGLSNYLIPFFGVLMAAVLLGEHLTRFMVLGGVLVLGSTLLITVFEEVLQKKSS
jgi:drug/metabolite transporter (DMT)-like permease